MNIDRVIVGLDLVARGTKVSDGSLNALAQARWVSDQTGAGLTIVHSTYADTYREPLTGNQVVVHAGLSDEGRAALEGAREEAQAAGYDCELEVSSERPWIALSRAMLSKKAQLVIVGKRSGGEAEGRARKLGSVATKLLRKCPGHVWVVKPEHDLGQKLVLAATDLTDAAKKITAAVAA